MNWFNNPWDTDSLPGQENPNVPANQPPSRPVQGQGQGQGQRNDNPYGGAFAMIGAMLSVAASLDRNRRCRTDYRSEGSAFPPSPLPLPPQDMQLGGSPQPLKAQYARHKWEREWGMEKTNESAEPGLWKSPQQEEGGIVNPYKELAEKTKDKALKNEYLRLHAQTDELLRTFRQNDPELYDYINSLKIKDKDGKETLLSVYILLEDTKEKGFEGDRPYDGKTSFKVTKKGLDYTFNGTRLGLFGTTVKATWPAGWQDLHDPEPIVANTNGFQINIWNLKDKSRMDDALANEAGDIMFAMNYFNSVISSNNIDEKGNLSKNYKKTRSQNYSSNVEYIYKRRKTGTLSKEIKIYPLGLAATNDEKLFMQQFEQKYPLTSK